MTPKAEEAKTRQTLQSSDLSWKAGALHLFAKLMELAVDSHYKKLPEINEK